MKLTLLSRAYCHLCDEMLAAVQPIARAHGAMLRVIDVDAPGNATLEAEWGERVPALFSGEPHSMTLLCHYRLDPARVDHALRGSIEYRAADKNPL